MTESAKDPGKYVNKIWGEYDAGGTSVLYLSNIDLSFLSAGHVVGPKPLPDSHGDCDGSRPVRIYGRDGLHGRSLVDHRAPHEA